MNLLLIIEDKDKYVFINDLNKFMYNKAKHRDRKHFCIYCLQCFSSENVLNNRKTNCMVINGKQAINMPEKGSTIKFNNFRKQQAVPFVTFSDFEASTEKIDSCQTSDNKSYTEAYQKQTEQIEQIEIPQFYKSILQYFWKLKESFPNDPDQQQILFNNKDILIEAHTFFFIRTGLIAGSILYKIFLKQMGNFSPNRSSFKNMILGVIFSFIFKWFLQFQGILQNVRRQLPLIDQFFC